MTAPEIGSIRTGEAKECNPGVRVWTVWNSPRAASDWGRFQYTRRMRGR